MQACPRPDNNQGFSPNIYEDSVTGPGVLPSVLSAGSHCMCLPAGWNKSSVEVRDWCVIQRSLWQAWGGPRICLVRWVRPEPSGWPADRVGASQKEPPPTPGWDTAWQVPTALLLTAGTASRDHSSFCPRFTEGTALSRGGGLFHSFFFWMKELVVAVLSSRELQPNDATCLKNLV